MKRRMSQDLSEMAPPRHPHGARGSGGGEEQLSLNVATPASVRDHLRTVYGALQLGVDQFGGIVALAAALGKNHGEVGRRVRREEDDKGDLQRAFLDYVAVLATDWRAREAFLKALCLAWGYKSPEALKEPSTEEKYRALVSVLRGDLGDDVLERAAEVGGFNVGAFRR